MEYKFIDFVLSEAHGTKLFVGLQLKLTLRFTRDSKKKNRIMQKYSSGKENGIKFTL